MRILSPILADLDLLKKINGSCVSVKPWMRSSLGVPTTTLEFYVSAIVFAPDGRVLGEHECLAFSDQDIAESVRVQGKHRLKKKIKNLVRIVKGKFPSTKVEVLKFTSEY